MIWMDIPLLAYVLLYLLYQFVLLFLIYNLQKTEKSNILQITSLPFVSILVAAKDEAKNIEKCLASLEKLDYPIEKIEILIGNDNSEDNTKQIVENFIEGKNQFTLLNIEGKLGLADAKANVLAQLARIAKGEYFLITDADVQVPIHWVKTLLSYQEDNIGIISASTAVEGEKLFSRLQNMEWLYSFGLISSVKTLNIPVTAVGNNMMISRKAYESVGGYENIPFSVTEDFALFKATLNKGWGFEQLLVPDALCYTQSIPELSQLLQQRKRWMQGAVKVPWILKLFLSLQASYGLILIVGLIFLPLLFVLFINLKVALQYLFIKKIYQRLKLPLPSVSFYLLFEIYTMFIAILTVFSHLMPTKVVWKGRSFNT